ncbi:YDG domain-containing protein [Pseudomonas sp. CC6-YY-74]|uniref:YDG domain-containing protein n=1 Tax=Pseudomonas sp. CC6-YY-74 TaxID=1930532 RepID=UPI0009A232DF|nr:YDG domain-containing protein [Pseudomonas sp. CC6-YY-74]
MKGRGSLNHLYRLVWSQVLGAWIAVAETTKGRGKGASRKLLVAVVGLSSALAQAAPEGGQVVSGTGSIAQSGATTTITQATQNLSLNWDSFNIAAQETVNFNQPSATAIAVNRIMDSNGTQILGNLNANGQVYLINPNGILFGQGAQVNVGALVASTLDLNDASLNSDSRSFSGDGAGSVINRGTLNAAASGYVALLGNTVSNQGTITAPRGSVALGAGSAATLTFADNSLVQMQVDQSLLNNLADNGGLIQANGGRVLMSAGAKDALLASVVNNTGVIEARTVENHDGVIVLLGGMQAGTVQVAGTLDASAPNGGDGGFIETSAAHVKVADNAKITTAAAHGKTGTWLIDPSDFTIAASGGDMTADTVTSNLANTNFEIATATMGTTGGNGDIAVNQALSWSSANTLTLTAERNIAINNAITATNGGLTLNAAGSISAPAAVSVGTFTLTSGNWSQTGTLPTFNATDFRINGGSFIRALSGDGSSGSAYRLADVYGLQGIASSGMLGKNYVLANNIDASGTSNWNAGAGFNPIGVEPSRFSGSFDGLGHTIANLTINRPSTFYVGLFGITNTGSVIQNVGLLGGSVIGNKNVGGLMGYNYKGTVSNSYATGSVSGNDRIGGLVGFNETGTISNSYATGSVSGSSNVGGLVGTNFTGGTISNSYADSAITGGTYAGGLVGFNQGTIQNSYSSGTVFGSNRLGGLVGVNESIIANAYSTAAVTSDSNEQDNFGGLVGINTGNISNSYANGVMQVHQNQAGGLIGWNGGTITNSYWNTETSGQSTSAAGLGLTTTQMQTASNFTGFTFTSTPGASGNNWVMVDADGGLNNANGSPGATRPMLASEYSTTINNAHQLQLMAMNLSASYTLGANVNAATTGLIGGISTDVWGSAGFVPLGNSTIKFSGTFDGLGHTISNLTINRPLTNYVGLFGNTGTGSVIRNVGLLGGSVSGDYYVGGLVGYTNGGAISNSYSTGSVIGNNYLGGLAGYSYASAVGNSYATGNVSGTNFLGGLVGHTNGGAISNSYATGSVSGSLAIGGLVGGHYGATISNSYAAGLVIGSGAFVGGLVGSNSGTISSSYWNSSVKATGIGGGTTTGATGLTGAQLMQQASFSSWNTATPNTIANTGGSGAVWRIYEGHTAPLLTSFLTGLTLSGAPDATVTYNGAAQSGGAFTLIANVLGAAATGTNAGFYNGYYSTQQGYDITGGNLTINQADLTLSTNNITKTYDGGLTAVGTAVVASGTLFTGDSLTGGSFTFADKNVGSGNKTVTVTGVTVNDGNSGGNYNISYADNIASTINKFNLSVSGLTASDKTYDANTTATLGGTASIAKLGSDDVAVIGSASGTFASKNAGTQSVTVSGNSLTGSDAGNYNLLQQTGLTATIGKADLSVTGLTANDKTYDANTAAALGGTAAIAKLGSDDVAVIGSASGTFASKNAGTQSVTVSGNSLSGSDAGNYNLLQQTGLTAAIGKADLSVTGLTASGKVYDANTAAALGGTASIAKLGSDDVAVIGSASGTFASKNAGTQSVTVSGNSLTGSDAGNYNLLQQTGLTAAIGKADLSVTGFTASGKVYDANTAAALGGTASIAKLGSDDVAVIGSASGTFASKNAGTQSVTVSGNSLTGSDAGNYNLLQQTGLTAAIGKADLSVTGFTASGKVYDANTAAALGGTASIAKLGSDDVAVIGSASGTFASKNAGTQSVTVSGNSLSGSDAGNYNLLQQAGLTATIGKADVSVTGLTASGKVYDANTAAALGGTASIAKLGSDDVAVIGSASGTFASKNAGTQSVTVSGNSLSGSDAGNYNLLQQTGLTAAIGKADVSVTGLTASGKVYDANTAAALGGTASIAKLGSDDVAVIGSVSGTFASKNAGTQSVTVSGNSLSGSDAGNYNLLQQTGLTAAIGKADLSVTGITADSKVYDGNTGVSLNTATASLNGLLAGDKVTVGAAGAFDSKNVGAGKTVALVSHYAGADLGNYRISDQGSTAADITRATLTYAATPASFFSGRAPGALSGGVSGFVSGETLAGSTRGAPIWTTAAGINSQPGVYAINGGGLTASNYLFAQAAGNARALTLTPGVATNPVVNVTTQLASSVLSPQASSQPQALNLSSSIRVSQSANADSGAAGVSSAADANNSAVLNTQMTIGSAGPSLQIVNGGVKLPDNMVAEK